MAPLSWSLANKTVGGDAGIAWCNKTLRWDGRGRFDRPRDYAEVIEALRSSKIQFARIGAANYALGRKVMGDKIAPVGLDETQDGSTGYYSVIVVKADS